MTIVFFIVALYLVGTLVAAWLLSNGLENFSMPAMFILAFMWPMLLILIAISVYEEWRYRLRNGV